MRNPISALASLSLLLSLAACAVTVKPVDPPTEPVDPPAPQFDNVQSALPREVNPQLAPSAEQALVAGNTAFALDLFARATAGKPNAVVSPHSISTALAMTYARAAGSTKIEMAKAMHFTLPDSELHRGFNWLDQQIASRAAKLLGRDGKAGRVAFNNSLFVQRGFVVKAPFLDVLGAQYGAAVYLQTLSATTNVPKMLLTVG
jgi:serpin B